MGCTTSKPVNVVGAPPEAVAGAASAAASVAVAVAVAPSDTNSTAKNSIGDTSTARKNKATKSVIAAVAAAPTRRISANQKPQSVIVMTTAQTAKASPKRKLNKKKNGTSLVTAPSTRARADTWEMQQVADETNYVPALAAASQVDLNAAVQKQWQTLWETQSAALVDPADVVSVLDHLICSAINKLSPVQITLLQRKVRSAVKQLPKQEQGSKIAKVFSGTANYSDTEARAAVDKFRLLTAAVLQRILPVTAVSESIVAIMLSFGGAALTERVLTAATDAAKQAGLEMDVNKQAAAAANGWNMPKPSQVPVLDEPVQEWPAGASFAAVAAVIAMATASSSRSQRLQLLFYALMDAEVLRDFLSFHPAGGMPVWLLEVGNHTVISLPSLTHYHYYGNAFLPCEIDDSAKRTNGGGVAVFAASKSRLPVTVDADRVQQLVRDSLRHATSRNSVNGSAAGHNYQSTNSNVSYPSDEGGPASPRLKDSVSMIGPPFVNIPVTRGSIHKSGSANDLQLMAADSSDHAERSIFPKTTLMLKLQDVADGVDSDTYSPMAADLDRSVDRFETATAAFLEHHDVTEWTLQEFRQWADAALDDSALDVVMHRLFSEGILPSPALERELVLEKWLEWQVEQGYSDEPKDGQSVTEMLTNSISALLGSWHQNGEYRSVGARLGAVWGGIGGIDGLGGTGHGVLYCVPAAWWDAWKYYAGWSFVGDRPKRRKRRARPASLQTESLLEKDPDNVVRGIMGSYEVMRRGLKRGRDYVLVPPGVWDILFELYSGGPPLPRMVQSPERKLSESMMDDDLFGSEIRNPVKSNSSDELDEVMGDLGVGMRVMRIPDRLSVETHPWVLHVHLCDPLQPYRRGDTGPWSIRVMACPDQPLWRLFSEIVCRFSFQSYKAFNAEGRGMARLWKKLEPTGAKDTPLPRYGPWNLLCKSRHAILPQITNGLEMEDNYNKVIADWKLYGDNATVESVGLFDHHNLMLEFAVQNKNGELTWPREAAATAGKVRRLAEEDKRFRQLLQGVDHDGNMLLKPPPLVGLNVDAMDLSGRWYTVKILDVDFVDDDTDEDSEDNDEPEDQGRQHSLTKKRVKVSFRDHGGHFDWIDVESDRIQTAGRFASEAEQQASTVPTNGIGAGANGEARSKSGASTKRTSSNSESTFENTKSCALPGFGACGLTNLGNTCYMNSAVQCMAYLPLLRAYLLGAQYKATGDLNKDNPLGTGGKLLEEFAELQRSVWGARLAEKSPNRFRTQLGKTNEQFSGADQQDAQEFLNYMIDVLHEDSNKVRKKPYVEPLEDEWVEKTSLPRVGEEAWRRFLRRNQSIMADVAMGQALNTVICPVCHYSSRNFDPFNLLSIPIPTVADVIFQCTVLRRSTARNCPWILNKPRKNDTRTARFPGKLPDSATGLPSETFIAEQYVIALSRLADVGDLRLQIQNLSGIRSNKLRLCRAEEFVLNNDADDDSVTKRQIKVFPLADKDGPASQHAKKRSPNEEDPRSPTQIIAFELTLNTRQLADNNGKDDTIDDVDDDSQDGDELYPSRSEKAVIERHLAVYGDEKECRLFDTDTLVIAKAVSRSLWPRSDSELKIGLRVDAKDHRGNWFPGSIIDIFDQDVNGGDADTGQEVAIQQKQVRVHFDNFLPKWDEVYSIEHFKQGRVNPLYYHAEPKGKPTEFLVHHRCIERTTGHSFFFGQSFYVQCMNEWSNARAGAHILAQASRFLRPRSDEADPHPLSGKVHSSISELIDLLIDCDREFIRLALGVSKHNSDEERAHPYRNPTFDATALISASNKKVSAMLHRLPFELRLCTIEAANADKSVLNSDELSFPFALNMTIGNFVSIRNAVILHWREPPVDKKSGLQRNPRSSVLYAEPTLHVHESSAELLNSSTGNVENGKKRKPGSAGIDLGFCLTEFCKVQKLPMSDNWKCPRCKVIREGGQNMNLWRLPDLLTFHIKRFNMSARWHEKITTNVNFPMTGLDMSEWCHKESPVLREESEDSYIYDLIGVMNHYGSMTGGHYVATCKATLCGREGKEEVAYNFSGVGASVVEIQESDEPSGWGLGRSKPKVNQSRLDAVVSSKAVADSAEPMWLQFDDEVVEVIPPRLVVSEMAYVLFYRKRRITPSNIAKYSTLE